MTDVIRFAITKWLESGEYCDAMLTDMEDLRKFADEWQMILEGDKESLTEEEKKWPHSPHQVPVVICPVSLTSKGDFGPIFDAIMQFGDATDCTDVEDLLRHLFFQGFMAGMKYREEESKKPIL
ncbi:MAG TPA: hypothetical protein VLG69_03215 [Candidatus Andersenbacteria bacterium]|nr:hypothetical protein [Candidatus Andersenbacteria bacterium]